jgi:hypothetical protein
MSSKPYCPRLEISKTQSNVLMAQIRAEKKKYNQKGDVILTPNRVATGRKHLRLDLYAMTDITHNFLT